MSDSIGTFAYTYDSLGRRTQRIDDSSITNLFGYNLRSELVSAEMGTNTYSYAYDPIGNRVNATEYDESGAPLVAEYAANELNQYIQRTVPGYASARGEAPTNVFVTVNERPVARVGEYFHRGDYADNTLSNLYADLEIYAALNPPETNTPDTVYAVTTSVFVAKTPETFTYDADGNMTSDGRFAYTWNDENRMVSASNAEVCVTYAYDHRGRMVRKNIQSRDAEPQSISYLWDNWNIVREIHVSGLASRVTHNIWGLDLDGTLQGAGGVGGLLAVICDDGAYLPTYDANSNITEYVSTNGEVAAHYDYSPFGETLVSSGPLAASFTHRFSTKPYCANTGLVEYQLRKSRPDIGRWMSRDPIGDASFGCCFTRRLPRLRKLHYNHTANYEYLLVDNSVNFYDVLGLCKIEVRYNLLDCIFGICWYHAYVVVTDVYGTQTYYRGGPSAGGSSSGRSGAISSGSGGSASDSSGSDTSESSSSDSSHGSSGSSNSTSPGSSPGGATSSSFGPWGPITTEFGPYIPGSIDYNSGTPPSIIVLDNSEPCDCYTQKLQDALIRIHDAKIPYNPFGDNSNATAHQIIEDAGFSRPISPVWAPGNRNEL